MRKCRTLPCELAPRDFMRYNERLGAQEIRKAFEVVELPHGLFAVASCLDVDLENRSAIPCSTSRRPGG